MANTRTASCTLRNESSYKLTRVDDQVRVTLGQWAKDGGTELKPPKEIAPGASGSWRTESNPGPSTDISTMGTSGTALYTYEKDGTRFEVNWAAPVAGTNTWSQVHRKKDGAPDEGGSCSGDQKNDATFTFTFKPTEDQAASNNNRAPSVPPPPPSGATINAQATCGKTTHISPPEGSKNVMIVPKRGPQVTAGGIFDHSIRFADQWRKADMKNGATRAVLTLSVNGPFEEFKRVMIDAANMAKGGEIILMTGHGLGVSYGGMNSSMMDTMPELIMKKNEAGVMEDSTWDHKQSITTDNLVELLKIADVVTNPQGKRELKPKQYQTKENVAKREPHKYLMLDEIGQAFERNGVKRFVGLTCNAGKDVEFCKAIATVLRAEFQAYKYLVVTGETDGMIQIWLTKEKERSEKDRPKTGGNKSHPSFYEIPTDTAVCQVPNAP